MVVKWNFGYFLEKIEFRNDFSQVIVRTCFNFTCLWKLKIHSAGIILIMRNILVILHFHTLTVTRVFKEISIRPRVPHYQVFSARYSHGYFSNVSRSSGGLKNSFSFRLFAILKSLAVIEYNEGKYGIDYSDQMVSYAIKIKKGIKWYRKFGAQLLLGISVVNALTVYKIATRKDINIRIFGELLAAKLLGLSENTKNPCFRQSQHNITVRKIDSGRSIRCVCKLCYANKRRRMNRTKTQKN